MDTVRDITVVGGGDSGLLAALAIKKRNPEIDISVVDDFEQEQTTVGKSTFVGILDVLHNFLEIDDLRFLRNVKPVFKSSVFFRDWCGYPPFHYPFDLERIQPGTNDTKISEKYYLLYDEVYTNSEYRTTNEEMVERGKTPYTIAPNGQFDRYPSYAYQLNTHRFNRFLRSICEERGIPLIDDRISEVHSTGNYISKIEGENMEYRSNLYIDASGFDRILKQRVDNSFKDFNIPLDSAFNTQIDRSLSEVVPATVVETGDYGWFWQIDTFDNRDLGYVFSSDHVADDSALSEFLEFCGISEAEAEITSYEFTSGYFENAWKGNCIAIGNAEGFVEPLQSTGLTANAQIGIVLSILLNAHGRTMHAGIRDTFNGYVRSVWESIYDFIYMHYKYSSGDSEFWETMQSLDGSPRTDRIIEEYNKNGLITAVTPVDASVNITQYSEDIWNLVLFPLPNYYAIMRKMGAKSEFYENNDFQVTDAVREELRAFYDSMQSQVEPYLTMEDLYQLIQS